MFSHGNINTPGPFLTLRPIPGLTAWRWRLRKLAGPSFIGADGCTDNHHVVAKAEEKFYMERFNWK
jgi:hypothetical protein